MSGPAEVYQIGDELDFVRKLGTWATPCNWRYDGRPVVRLTKLLGAYITHSLTRERMPAPFFKLRPAVELAIDRLRSECGVTIPDPVWPEGW